jgi:hypothetical protein
MLLPNGVFHFVFCRYDWSSNMVESRHQGTKYNDKPMTGWTAVMVALQMCDSVSLYGFQVGGGDTPFTSLTHALGFV